MNKVKRFFTNTIPNAFRNGVTLVRNNPMKSLAATVAVVIGGSSMVSAMSSKKYDKASDPSLDAQNSIVQDADETTTTYTSTTTTTTTTTGVTTGVSKTDSKETGTTVTTADETEFLSDYFKKYVEKVEFEDNNQPYIIDDENLLEQNGYIVNEDGTITNTEGYTFDGNGGYITEDVVIEGDYFVAPDGIIYTSKDAYEKLNTEADKVDIENHDEEVLDFELIEDRGEYSNIEDGFKIDGNYYIDADGIVWTSEEAYIEFINPDYNFEGYIAPDGSKWSSEQDYLDSLKGYEEVEAEQTTGPVVTEPTETQTETTTTDEYYTAPDGSKWSSEQDYLDSLQDYVPAEETTAPVVTEPTGTTTTEAVTELAADEDEYYTAPDGSKWTSKEAYEEYKEEYEAMIAEETTAPVVTEPTGTTTTETTTTETTTTTEAVGGNDEPQAPIFTEEPAAEEDEYYTAPDGSKWTSKEAYEEYKEEYEAMIAEEEAAKQTTTATTTTATETTTTETTTTTAKPAEETTPKNTTTATETTKKQETTTTTTENKQDDYYVAPDGSIWTSEADYLEFINEFEVETQKTR